MEKDTSRRFSPSKLNTYQNCPRRYQYRYVDKIKRDRPSIEAFLGTCAHAALETLYEGVRNGKLLTLDETLAVFEGEWDRSWSSAVEIRKKEYSAEDYRTVGRDCVRSYYKRFSPFDQDKTVKVEAKTGFVLTVSDDGEEIPVRIEGYIDRLANNGGTFEVHDYKTSSRLPTQQDSDEDWQLAIYELALRSGWPDTEKVRLVWHYLRHDKDIVSTRTPEQLEALKGKIETLVLQIWRDSEFVPNKTPLCDWCEYRDLCPLFKHGEAVAKLPAAKRSRDSGVQLVKEFAELDAKKKGFREEIKRIEKEQKGLERDIVEMAQSKGISAISGAEGEILIVKKEVVKFPTKTHSPEKLQKMEGELKATAQWPEVSRLDPHLMTDGIKEKRWAGAALLALEAILERYTERVTERPLRFHRKKDPEAE